MNLNQAAHGDREFGYIQTRLGRRPQDRRRPRRATRRVAARIGAWARAAPRLAAICARCGWPGSATTCATSPSPRATRSRPSCASASRSTPTASTISSRRSTRRADADVDALVAEYDDAYGVAPGAAAGGDRHESLRYAARIELGLRAFLSDGGFGAFTTNFEDLGGLRQLPGLAVQRLMADGYGFGGEGDWKTSTLLRTLKAMGDGLPAAARRSWRTTPTTSGPGEPKILGAHMLEVCPTIAAGKPSLEIHPLGIGGREDPVRLVFDAAPGPAVVVGIADLGDRFRLVANEIEVVAAGRAAAEAAGRARGLEAGAGCRTSAEAWLTAGGPHHTVLTRPSARRPCATSPTCWAPSCWSSTTTPPGASATEIRWNQAYYRLAQGLPGR